MRGEDGNPHTGLEIGKMLEQARAERGLSLWQVEEATKIRARYLRELERENFDVLPAVYVFGSLKTYADFLGLDGEALVQELKNRQEPAREEEGTSKEEPPAERGGFLASLAVLLGFGGRGAEDEMGTTGPAPGRGSRLYWGLGGTLIVVSLVSLASALGGGGSAVPQIREPALSEAPARVALSSDVEVRNDKDRDAKETVADRSEGEAKASDENDKGNGKAEDADRADEKDEDRDAGGAEQEKAGDAAITPPASSSASASAASSASASSSAIASAPATAAATSPASSVTASAAPQATNPGATPADDQTAPVTARAPVGPPRTGAAPAPRPVQRTGDVRIIRRVVLYVR